MEEVINEYKCMVGAYYGVKSMDEYDLKEYVLSDIKNYIINFINNNRIENFDYEKCAKNVYNNTSIITKLQDSLIVLSKMNASLELILLIKKKIRKLKKEENDM